MFGRNPLNAYPSGIMAGLAPVAMSNPGGPMNGDQPGAMPGVNPASVLPMAARLSAAPRLPSPAAATIRAPDPSKFKGQIDPSQVAAPAAGAAAPAHHGMFGNPKLGNVILTLLAGLEGFQAGRGVPGAAEAVSNLQNAMQYHREQQAADAQSQQNYQALVARGMNPNDALIMAQNPLEMAKHLGTHFDQKVLNQGATLATPEFNGSVDAYTAPDVQRNGADVVQTPGVQGVTPPFSSLPTGAPQPLGAPTTIPGLRTDAEQYAGSIGAQPGTPDYLGAVQDYTLKGSGPTAFGHAQTLQDARLSNSAKIAAERIAASTANNHYRVDHPAPHAARAPAQPHAPTPSTVVGGIMAKQAAGQPLTPAEQATLVDYRTRHKPQAGAVQVSPNEPVATDAHGNKLVVRNGQWVPAK